MEEKTKPLKTENTENTENKEHKNRLHILIHYYYWCAKQDLINLFKWILLAVFTGVVVGGISSLFSFALTKVTAFREGHLWIFCFYRQRDCLLYFYTDG